MAFQGRRNDGRPREADLPHRLTCGTRLPQQRGTEFYPAMRRSKLKGVSAADRTQGGQRRGHGGYRSEQEKGGFEKHRSVPSNSGASFVSGSYARKKRNEHARNWDRYRIDSFKPIRQNSLRDRISDHIDRGPATANRITSISLTYY